MAMCDVILENEFYRAEICSADGGNCYRLYEKAHAAELLRMPSSDEEPQTNRFLFGTPLLFPANRIRTGRFTFGGREYVFPVNEPETGCHLHGELYRTPFTVLSKSDMEAVLEARFQAGEYLGFPHAFSVTRSFSLRADGLHETLQYENRSDSVMPLMTAYHTTFRVPVTRNGRAEDYRLTLPVAREHKRNAHYIPTCEYEDGAKSEALRSGAFQPCDGTLTSAFFRATGDTVLLCDVIQRIRVRYRTEGFSYFMLYNGGSREFVCVEPQTNAIDAFHIDMSPEDAGVIAIPPFGSHTLKTVLSLETF